MNSRFVVSKGLGESTLHYKLIVAVALSSRCVTVCCRLREVMKDYSLIVASYEIVRNDIDFLRTITWNYCVLDEGHIIKNPKSKV